MISFRLYPATSHRSLKPLFSRQNLIQLSAFRKMSGERKRGGSLNSRGRRSPSFRYSQRSSPSAPYDSSVFQKDESSIPTYDINDNGHSCLGGHWQERKVGGESRDRYSSSRPRCSPFAQDSTNSRKSHEHMFQGSSGEGNQDGNLSYRERRSPSVEDSSNPCESASSEGQKDEPSSATSDDDDTGHSHMGGHEHERKVGEGSQDYLNSHKCASYKGQKDEPSIPTSAINDNGHSHIVGHHHEQMVREGSQDRYSSFRPRHSPSAQDSPNSRKSGLFPKGSRSRRIGISPARVGNADNRSHVDGPQHRRMARDDPVAPNSTFEHVERSFAVSCIEDGLIQDRAANHNLPQQIDSTEKGKETGFDICPRKTAALVKLNASLLSKNREKRKEQVQMEKRPPIEELRHGMILLKSYLDHSEQVEIIRECQKLGRGKGGFYQPGYSDGAKLRLHMMCLGKDWDPETRLYRDRRSVDDAEPPSIPDRFKAMVERSLQASHDFIRKNSKGRPEEDILPKMKPDICIVNFYTDNGKLGLHQDRDESQDSLRKGLPVVSFSIGDSAWFLYGDDRDEGKAEKVRLESGDVLIFGGKSRHIYHGVPSIFTGSAPRPLVDETNLCGGRLNLTFRQY